MRKPMFGELIRIKQNSPFFAGELARVAYIGNGGISVYLKDDSFDDCIPLHDDEYEFESEAHS